MRVDVLAGASRNEGGLLGAVRGLSLALAAQDARVRLISHIDEHTPDDVAQWAPIPVVTHAAYGPLLSSPRLRGILAASDAELVHVHGLWVDRQWAALQWTKKTGKPVVISPHGMLDPWAVRNSAWKKKLIGAVFGNASLRRATCLHALCDSEADAIRSYGVETPVAVIPNGIELPADTDAVEVGDRRRLLFLGRIHPKKGIAELLAGWAASRPEGWELVIAGWDDGGHEPGLKNRVKELKVADSVTFAGPKFGAEKDALIRSSHGFVLPSFSEGLPMSVLEAWSYRLPVVMSEFCNLPAGFERGAALEVAPAADSIARGLDRLAAMSEPDLAAMAAAGRALVEQRFTWERIAADMRAVYHWCLGGEKPACIRST